MKEPRRLLQDSTSTLERALLDAGASYRCSADSRLKTLAAVGLAGSTALTAAAVGVAGTSFIAKITGVKLWLTVSALGAITMIPLGYRAWQRHQVPVTAAVSAQIPPGSDGPKVAHALQAAPQNTAASDENASTDSGDLNAVGTKVSPGNKGEARPEVASSGLANELAALDAARTLLSNGDAKGALARLDNYGRSYPRGRLKLEAEVLRIDALNRSGQPGIAKQRGEAFLRKYPNSVLASRVRTLLGP